MKVRALAAHTPEAVRAALSAHGWDAEPARLAATGLTPLVLLLEDITDDEREALVRWAARVGADLLTGPGWGVLACGASRVATLARFDRSPEGLARLVEPLARALMAHADPPRRWRTAGGDIPLAQPVLIGILNVTPDSFSDGGRFAERDAAVAHAERLKADGAHLLDVGGESTRPGAQAVPPAEERARVVPVITELVRRGLGPVSVDTRSADVARAALAAGAAVVNDVSGLTHDPTLAGVVRAGGAGLIVMHSRGTPATMDTLTAYQHVAAEVAGELAQAVARAVEGGVAAECLAVDPGFGFAKSAEQSLRLLDELATIVGLGYPVVVGPSRKRFLGAATGRDTPDRDRAAAVACALAWERGARLFRIHDVTLTAEALALASAVSNT